MKYDETNREASFTVSLIFSCFMEFYETTRKLKWCRPEPAPVNRLQPTLFNNVFKLIKQNIHIYIHAIPSIFRC
jgi:hypothetical protein